MIKTFRTKTFIERLYCDNCGTEMQSTGIALTTYPAQYPYKCPNCGEQVTVWELYPRSVVKEAGEVKKKD